jgi:8-oxo-dGTP diphosphatase
MTHNHESSSVRHMTASMVVIDLNTERVLLIGHKATGLLMFPGGHIDANEAPHQAALREVEEETGVKALVHSTQPYVQLPGMRSAGNPWMTFEIPAPAKPARPGKPAEDAHTHIDLLFIGTADSAKALSLAEGEVYAGIWAPISRLSELEVRSEVPQVAVMALATLRALGSPQTTFITISGSGMFHVDNVSIVS